MDNLGTFVVDHSPRGIFGTNTHQQTGSVLKESGCKKVLVVHDPSIGALGIADRVMDSIREAGIEMVVFGEAEPEPTSESMNRAGMLGREEGVDGVVGIGGGSSLDTAKGANLLLSNDGTLEDYIGKNRGVKPIVKKYPIVLLPTTAGTSAEITPVFAVTESATGKKTGARNRGDVAIVDPVFAQNMPAHITAMTGIDMLSHVTESLINPTPHMLTEWLDERVIETVFRYLPLAYRDVGNAEYRSQLAFSCMSAGYAFADKGTYIGHVIADQITNRFHCPHGVACAPGLLVTLRYAAMACPEKMRRIARVLGISLTQSDERIGEDVLAQYRQLISGLQMKSMKELGVDEALLRAVIEDIPKNVRFRNSKYPPDIEAAEKALYAEWEAG